ncbi:MAG: glutamate--tRNA ligase family protein, partial [Mycobacteriaceae bacterium]
DILSSTPRQLALYEALQRIGAAEFTPQFGHLPFVMGTGNKKLSKRDPEANLFLHRERGFIPEGLLNYLALLGWAIADDHDLFSLDEMAAAFDIGTVNVHPARFDQKKADAINAEHIRLLEPADFAQRLLTHLQAHEQLPTDVDRAVFDAAAALVQTRIVVLSDAAALLGFLFVAEADFAVDEAAAAKALGPAAEEPLNAALGVLQVLPTWRSDDIEAALKAALVEGLGLKPRKAFTPIRVAITGSTISPPLFESMELLGRKLSLARLQAAAG